MVKPTRIRKRERRPRIKDADLFKTVEEVFDVFTLQHLERLLSKGVIWELKGVISSGKEARVYWGKDKKGRDLAVKIYLSATAEFRKSIKKYIMGDPRFESIPKHNFRKLIYAWTRKEYRNLVRMKKAGVNVPEPIAFSGNILVMEFLGEEGYRAPLLVEVIEELGEDEINRLYREVLRQIRLIVCEARLVHADLSEYNIIIWKDEPWIIDVSQAVELYHPLATEFLQRDIENITTFFSRYIDLELDGKMEEIRRCLQPQ